MTIAARNIQAVGAMQLRDYQQDSVDAAFRCWSEEPQSAPLIVIPTGGGKSVIVAEMCRRYIEENPGQRALCVIHVKELVGQNYKKFREHQPHIGVGIFSASLGRKDYGRRVTFANVQSIHRVADRFRNVGLLLIDEAHLLPHADEGMYRNLIRSLRANNPHLRICGLTATPWRTNSGNLCEAYGEDQPIFTEVAYELPMTELLRRGFLSPMRAVPRITKMDTGGVHTRGGDFIEKELDAKVNTEEINRAIVAESVDVCQGQNRRSWLTFCVTIDHARRVRDIFREHGVTCEMVSGETPQGERDRIIRDFIAGRITCVTNCNVLSTGFDYPGIDAIIMARPTKSPGMFLQQAGRGLRIMDGKDDCLLLDFAGNTKLHGWLTHVRGVHKKKRDQEDFKECPACNTPNERSAETCVACGHVWQKMGAEPPDREAKLSKSQTTDRVMAAWEEGIEGRVVNAFCEPHVARSGITSLKVDYTLHVVPDAVDVTNAVIAGEAQTIRVQQYVCFEHEGWAQKQARAWWRQRSRGKPPETVQEAMGRLAELRLPHSLLVTRDGPWWRIESTKF